MDPITCKIGERYLLRVREDNSIGEFEFIAPTPSHHHEIVWTGRWWDGEFSGTDYLLNPERIVERTPENLKAAGKQLFPKEA